jgi:hypothetical protein
LVPDLCLLNLSFVCLRFMVHNRSHEASIFTAEVHRLSSIEFLFVTDYDNIVTLISTGNQLGILLTIEEQFIHTIAKEQIKTL